MGGCLVAAQLLAALPAPLPASPVADLERFARATGARVTAPAVEKAFHLRLPNMSDALRRFPCTADLCSVAGAGAAGVSMAVAAGPFTCAEDCAYAPLEALLAWGAAAQPDVLLLLGPFVDAEHPAVAGGLLPETFEELFMEQARYAQRCCALCLAVRCVEMAVSWGNEQLGML